MSEEMIVFTPSRARRFIEMYEDNLAHNRQSFRFEDQVFLMDWACHVVKYLQTKQKEHRHELDDYNRTN